MTRAIRVRLLAIAVLAALPAASFAQLTAAKDGPVVYGHHHLDVTSIDAHRTFWIDTLGGTPAELGPLQMVKFPNVLVLFTLQAPSGGTKGSSVNHLGFQVPDLRAAVDRVQAGGYAIVTREELPPIYRPFEKDGIAVIADQDTVVAFVMGPDETKVELFEVKGMTEPIALHHVHFATPEVPEMQAWYAKVFGAKPGKRGVFDAAALPGVSLTFSNSPEPVAATKGRALDHIGFEIDDLEAFTKKLEAMGVKLDVPYRSIPAIGLSIAFVTDPWGTYIELTEGLDQVQ